jgi:tellurite resistance protein
MSDFTVMAWALVVIAVCAVVALADDFGFWAWLRRVPVVFRAWDRLRTLASKIL